MSGERIAILVMAQVMLLHSLHMLGEHRKRDIGYFLMLVAGLGLLFLTFFGGPDV